MKRYAIESVTEVFHCGEHYLWVIHYKGNRDAKSVENFGDLPKYVQRYIKADLNMPRFKTIGYLQDVLFCNHSIMY